MVAVHDQLASVDTPVEPPVVHSEQPQLHRADRTAPPPREPHLPAPPPARQDAPPEPGRGLEPGRTTPGVDPAHGRPSSGPAPSATGLAAVSRRGGVGGAATDGRRRRDQQGQRQGRRSATVRLIGGSRPPGPPLERPPPAYREPALQRQGAYLRTRGLGPDFAKLWTANAVSNLGDGVTLVAGPLLAASLTRDPRLVAGLAVAQRLPWLLFSLVSGALVDRLDRRLLMVRVDAARCVAVGLLGVAVLADAASLPLLYVVFFALGTAETLFDNAAVSILPAVVPRAQLARANGRLLGAQMVANELVAPPLGGLLFRPRPRCRSCSTPGPSRPRPPWSRPWAAGSGSSGPRAAPPPPSARRSPRACAGWPGTACCGSWPWPSR